MFVLVYLLIFLLAVYGETDGNFRIPYCKPSLLSLLLLSYPLTWQLLSPFELRKPQPVAFFALEGYYYLMKLSDWFVIFLLRLVDLVPAISFMESIAVYIRVFSKYCNTWNLIAEPYNQKQKTTWSLFSISNQSEIKWNHLDTFAKYSSF